MRQKPYLLRTAIYVLLLPAVCVIPFALAQRNASKRSVAKPAATDSSECRDSRRGLSIPRAHRVR